MTATPALAVAVPTDLARQYALDVYDPTTVALLHRGGLDPGPAPHRRTLPPAPGSARSASMGRRRSAVGRGPAGQGPEQRGAEEREHEAATDPLRGNPVGRGGVLLLPADPVLR